MLAWPRKSELILPRQNDTIYIMLHQQNRERLYKKANGQLLILTAYDMVQLSGDMEVSFQQESSFWWLTGITESGWKVIIDGARRHTTLVRPMRSEVDIIFNGEADDLTVKTISGADEIISAKDFEVYLRQLHRKHAVVSTIKEPSGYEFVVNPAQRTLWGQLSRVFDAVQDCTKLLAELRAIKQPEEIARLERAFAVTTQAFSKVRDKLDTLNTEYEIEAEFAYHIRRQNAHYAYTPIVAAGSNACTLHYADNTSKVHARDMILIDVGARVDGYSADLTRTYCRRPTKRQKEVHSAVEEAHRQIIELLKPGTSVGDYIKASDDIMKTALEKLDLLEDRDDQAAYRNFFPHAISHGLGVDPHDSLGGARYFEPGMVIMVEPGIYIIDEGIGMRLEDAILITEEGNRNLSASLPTSL